MDLNNNDNIILKLIMDFEDKIYSIIDSEITIVSNYAKEKNLDDISIFIEISKAIDKIVRKSKENGYDISSSDRLLNLIYGNSFDDYLNKAVEQYRQMIKDTYMSSNIEELIEKVKELDLMFEKDGLSDFSDIFKKSLLLK